MNAFQSLNRRGVSLLGLCAFLHSAFLVSTGLAQTAPNPSPEEPVIELDPLAVVAHPSGADERTAAVWVVPSTIELVPSTSMADFLVGVPGVDIQQPGGPGARATLYLRGGEANHTVVFLDGVPLNDPTNNRGGSVDFSMIDPAMVATAAVVRGASSVRYGPETLAGVVHLDSTATGSKQSQLDLEAGGLRTFRGSFRTSESPADQVDLHFGGSIFNQSVPDRLESEKRRTLHGAITIGGDVRTTIAAWHISQNASAFPDDSGGFRHATIRAAETRDDRQTGISAQVARQGDGLRWTLHADAGLFDETDISPGVAPGVRDPAGLPASTDDTTLRRYRAGALVEQNVQGVNLAVGADVQREEGKDRGLLDFGFFQVPTNFHAARTRVGAFAETQTTVDGIAISGGARVDHFNDGLNRATLRAGAIGPVTEGLQWRINAGTGFKPPSFYALSNPLVGNPNLRPEKGETIDGGLRYTMAGPDSDHKAVLDLDVFSSRLRDGVDFDPGPPPRLVNRSEIRSRGVEFAAMASVTTNWALSGSLTYADTRSEPGDLRMRSRSRWRAGLATTWRATDAVSFMLRAINVGDVLDSSIATGDVVLGGWTRFDLNALWNLRPNLGLTVSLNNILDHRYEEAAGFPSPGRELSAGVRASF